MSYNVRLLQRIFGEGDNLEIDKDFIKYMKANRVFCFYDDSPEEIIGFNPNNVDFEKNKFSEIVVERIVKGNTRKIHFWQIPYRISREDFYEGQKVVFDGLGSDFETNLIMLDVGYEIGQTYTVKFVRHNHLSGNFMIETEEVGSFFPKNVFIKAEEPKSEELELSQDFITEVQSGKLNTQNGEPGFITSRNRSLEKEVEKIPYPMNMAHLAAENSKYNGTHVGAIISTKKKHILSAGWNGNHPGAKDDLINSLERDDRLSFVIHAEENAIMNAARNGTRIEGCDMYVTNFPCIKCIVRMFAAGIDVIYYTRDEEFEERWKSSLIQHLNDDEISRIRPI